MGELTVKGKNIGDTTRKSKISLKKDIYKVMFEELGEVDKKEINKKILISGENGTAKSSLALSLLTHDLQDDEVVIYVDIDNSGYEIIQSFYFKYYETHQVRHYNPTQTKDEGKRSIKDEEATAGAVGAMAHAISEAIENGFTIKGIIVDGLTFLLQYCEAVMRINKDKAADEGIPMGAWKIRNDEFRKIYSLYMALPTTIIFISHEDFIEEFQEKDLSSVKRQFINECSMRIITQREDSDNPDVENYIATVRKNRSDVTQVNKIFKFMSVNKKTSKIDFDAENLVKVIFPTET